MNVETAAVIDLGTNTFHLLIAEINERDEFIIREKYKEPVKLGEGGITAGKISKAAFDRGIRALKKFRKLINSREAGTVVAFATSAVRGASNGLQFVQKAKEQAGIDIEVINGNEEASLIFEGVKHGIPLPYNDYSLVVDIGGGSVEFIVTRKNKPLLIRSLDLGAARMLEAIRPSEPMKQGEIKTAKEWILQRLAPLLNELKDFDIKNIIGSSGSFETLGSLIAHTKNDKISAEYLNNYRFTAPQFRRVHKQLLKSNREDRLNMPGMEPMRVDMIPLASILVDVLMTELDVQQVILSLSALKEGVLYRIIEEKKERLHRVIGNADRSQRARAVRNLAKKYHADQEHGLQVGEMSMQLFEQLQHLHGYGLNERELLKYAAVLHDIGHFVNRSGHHKHGQYIVMNSNLPGFSSDELMVLSTIIRYHRKSLPSREHFHFKMLHMEDRLLIRTLAGILRIADSLDYGHRNLVMGVITEIEPDAIRIMVKAADVVDIEVNKANEMKDLLEQVFDKEVLVLQHE